jgi:hypothetical protein
MPTPVTNTAADAPRVDADSPWLGLLPYTEATQRFFFGRDAETRELFLRVRDQSVTVLYGQSGLGKTSLLGAGLIPKLRADGYRPALLRLRFGKDAPSLMEQVHDGILCALAGTNAGAMCVPPEWVGDTLWEIFHRPAIRPERLESSPLVLIFDQFEEVFTVGADQGDGAEIERLATELADLTENRTPATVSDRLRNDLDFSDELDFGPSPFRLVITLREDYLFHLEAWKAAFPSLMRNRIALHRLNGPQARDAVVLPGRIENRDLVSDDVGVQIVCFVAECKLGTPLTKIEAVPPLLSLVCYGLNEVRLRSGKQQITSELVSQHVSSIIPQFYQTVYVGLPDAELVRAAVEDSFVSESERRLPMPWDDAKGNLRKRGVRNPDEALETLTKKRLLTAEERNGTHWVELIHDLLIPEVVKSRSKRQEEEKQHEDSQ